jgi:uncharacterized cofD-like protein
VVLPLNLMTQPGETDGMSGPEHLDAIAAHVGAELVDTVLVNDAPLPDAPLGLYEASGSVPVEVDVDGLRARGVEVVSRDLLAAGPLIRHDPAKLSAAVVALASERLARAGAARRG